MSAGARDLRFDCAGGRACYSGSSILAPGRSTSSALAFQRLAFQPATAGIPPRSRHGRYELPPATGVRRPLRTSAHARQPPFPRDHANRFSAVSCVSFTRICTVLRPDIRVMLLCVLVWSRMRATRATATTPSPHFAVGTYVFWPKAHRERVCVRLCGNSSRAVVRDARACAENFHACTFQCMNMLFRMKVRALFTFCV